MEGYIYDNILRLSFINSEINRKKILKLKEIN